MMRSKIWIENRGAAAVEAALVLPVFLTFIYGIIQVALMFWTQASLYHGAQMAARCSALQQPACASTELTQQYAASQSYELRPAASVFTVSAEACGTQVIARYDYQPFSAFTSSLRVPLEARACFMNA